MASFDWLTGEQDNVDFKNVLKLVGAGITGGYLALKIRKPRRSYDEFIQIYDTLSIDFLRQLETTVVRTMLTHVPEEHRSRLDQLLDSQPTFLETLRFMQKHAQDFDELILRALDRFYKLREDGLVCSASHRKLPQIDPHSFSVAVDELMYELERSFVRSSLVNISPEAGERLRQGLQDGVPLTQLLIELGTDNCGMGPIVFDAIAQLESRLMKPGIGA